MIEELKPIPRPNGAETEAPTEETLAGVDRRAGKREWLGQVDFWEGVKDFILRRIPPGSRPVDRLY